MKHITANPLAGGISQFLRFCLVGFLNTGVDFVFYFFFTRIMLLHILLGNFLAFLISATQSYFLNKYFTFRDHGRVSSSQYIIFLLVASGALGLSELVLWVTAGIFRWHDLAGKGLAVFGMLIWNFFFSKFLVFRS